jgi:transposase InsO family protein
MPATSLAGCSLRKRNITASMSRKGNCLDNAPGESLSASLKVEGLYGRLF